MAKEATDDINKNNSGKVEVAKDRSKCITEQKRNERVERAGVATCFKILAEGKREGASRETCGMAGLFKGISPWLEMVRLTKAIQGC